MATKREQELQEEVDRLRKELEENRKLMELALVKIAEIQDAEKEKIPDQKGKGSRLKRTGETPGNATR